jgi:hypothetical protein
LLVSLVIAVLLALGRFGGIYLLLVHLPGFQQIHNPSRFLLILLLILGIASITAPPDGRLHTFYRQLVSLGMQGDNWGTAEQFAAFGRWSLLAAAWCGACLVIFLLLVKQVRRPVIAASVLLLLATDLFISNHILPFGPADYYRSTPVPIA